MIQPAPEATNLNFIISVSSYTRRSQPPAARCRSDWGHPLDHRLACHTSGVSKPKTRRRRRQGERGANKYGQETKAVISVAARV